VPKAASEREIEKLVSFQDVYHLSVIGLLLVVGALRSPRAGERIASGLGWLACLCSRNKRRVIEANVATAFGPHTDRGRIVRGCFQDFWREMLSWTSASPRGVRVTGEEHLRQALAEGDGAILLESGGFGRRLLVKQVLHSLGFALHQIHGQNALGGFLVDERSRTRARAALVKPFFESRERQFVTDIVDMPSSDSLAFIRDLRGHLGENAVLCVTGDGRNGRRLVPVRFLGRTVMFSSGTVSLARLAGAPLLPVFCAPNEDGVMRLTIYPPIRVDPAAAPDDDLQETLARYAALLETHVRRQPWLYRNWHLLGERVLGEGTS
jgi:lauroyl/myristoyl acyltransferase